MKKIIVICLVFFVFCYFINGFYKDEVDVEERGIFISYIELNKYVKDKNFS